MRENLQLLKAIESAELRKALCRKAGQAIVFSTKVPNPVSQIILADLVQKRGAAFAVIALLD